MEEDIIRGLLIDPYANNPDKRVQRVAVTQGLESYYEHLHCRCIDIVPRLIGGQHFDIVCDDEALLIDKPILSAVAADSKEPRLAGALLILRGEYDPDEMGIIEASLHDEDYDLLENHIMMAVDTNKSISDLTKRDCYPVLLLDGDGYQS